MTKAVSLKDTLIRAFLISGVVASVWYYYNVLVYLTAAHAAEAARLCPVPCP